jgi:hypothetical protein
MAIEVQSHQKKNCLVSRIKLTKYGTKQSTVLISGEIISVL